MKRIFFFILSILYLATGFAYGKTIAVTILPQRFITEKIAGSSWKVVSVIPEGADPHTFEPKISQMKKIADASAYFSIEESLDQTWTRKLLEVNKQLKIFKIDKGIQKIKATIIEEHSSVFHDPHIWLSFNNMLIIAENTKNALVAIDPKNRNLYEENYLHFAYDIKKLKEYAFARLSPKKGMSFLVFHPSWGYFAKEFALNQVAVEIEGREPSPKELKEIIDLARSKHVKVVFIQPQISSRTVETLSKELKIAIVTLDPLKYNWLENMKHTVDILSKELN